MLLKSPHYDSVPIVVSIAALEEKQTHKMGWGGGQFVVLL